MGLFPAKVLEMWEKMIEDERRQKSGSGTTFSMWPSSMPWMRPRQESQPQYRTGNSQSQAAMLSWIKSQLAAEAAAKKEHAKSLKDWEGNNAKIKQGILKQVIAEVSKSDSLAPDGRFWVDVPKDDKNEMIKKEAVNRWQMYQSTIPKRPADMPQERPEPERRGGGIMTVSPKGVDNSYKYTLDNQDPVGKEGDVYGNKWTGFQPRTTGAPFQRRAGTLSKGGLKYGPGTVAAVFKDGEMAIFEPTGDGQYTVKRKVTNPNTGASDWKPFAKPVSAEYVNKATGAAVETKVLDDTAGETEMPGSNGPARSRPAPSGVGWDVMGDANLDVDQSEGPSSKQSSQSGGMLPAAWNTAVDMFSRAPNKALQGLLPGPPNSETQKDEGAWDWENYSPSSDQDQEEQKQKMWDMIKWFSSQALGGLSPQ